MNDVHQTEGAHPADEPIVEFTLFVIAVKAPTALEDCFILCAGGAEQTVEMGFAIADLTEGIFT